MMKKYAVTSFVLAGVLITGCGSQSPVSSRAAVHARNGLDAAQSQAWASFGSVVIANRQKGPAPGQPAFDTFGPYLSQPVDITGDGDYSIIIGPLSVSDSHVPVIPGLHLPPDISFAPGVSSQMATFVGADGQTYGKFTLHVSNITSIYIGLTVWAD
jgi:hypothetical protein